MAEINWGLGVDRSPVDTSIPFRAPQAPAAVDYRIMSQADTKAPERIKPFDIDVVGSMAKGYQLADMEDQQNDKLTMNAWLKSGGKLTTPDDVKTALDELKGRISPNAYQKLQNVYEAKQKHEIDVADALARAGEHKTKMFADQNDMILKLLDAPLKAREETLKKSGDEGQANAAYQASLAASLAYMGNLPDPADPNKKMIDPRVLERYKSVSPEQLQSQIEATQWHQKLAQETLSNKFKQAQIDLYSKKEQTTGESLGDKIQKIKDDDRLTEEEKKNAITKLTHVAGSGSSVSTMSDDAIKYAAADYRQNGSAVLSRIGSQADRAKVVDEAARQAREEGRSGEAETLDRMAVKSNQQALNALTKQEQMIGAFEKTAEKQLGLVVELGRKIKRTDWPVINDALITGQKNIAGNPDASNFLSTIITTQADLARVLSGATSAAGTSDAARREAAEMLSKSLSQEQIESLASNIRRELEFKREGYREQKAELMKSSRFQGGQKEETKEIPKRTSKQPVNPQVYSKAVAALKQALANLPDEESRKKEKAKFAEYFPLPEGL